MNNKKGFAALAVVLIAVVILVVVGGIWYYKNHNAVGGPTLIPAVTTSTTSSPDYQLQSSEVSGLVTYLRANNLQAAVVQKIYDNAVSNWVVKSNGQIIFLDKRDLGSGPVGIGPYEPFANKIMGYKSAVGIYVLQDQAEINEWDAYGAGYDNEGVGPNKGTTRDISMYLTGHQVDPVWHANPLIASTLGVYAGWGEGNIISPDGKYIVMEEQSTTIGYPDVGNTITYQEYPILILAKVVRNGSSVTYQSITYLPTEGAEWSTDSRYVLMGNEIYDVQQNDGSYVKIASNGDDGYEHPVGDTIAFMNSAKNVVTTGTFVYANFGKVNQSIEFRKSDGSEIDALTQSGLFEPSSTVSGSLFLNMKNISLPNEIKIGGFIQ